MYRLEASEYKTVIFGMMSVIYEILYSPNEWIDFDQIWFVGLFCIYVKAYFFSFFDNSKFMVAEGPKNKITIFSTSTLTILMKYFGAMKFR